MGDRKVHGRGSIAQEHLLEGLVNTLHLENSLEWGNSLHLGCNMVDQEMGEVGCNGGGQVCRRGCNGE